LSELPHVFLLQLDLNSLASVQACAKECLSRSKVPNLLICNAGVMATSEGRTADGFEIQFGTHHLAHFLLYNLLKPVLLVPSSPDFNSRVIVIPSIAHRFSEAHFDNLNFDGEYNPWTADGQSETAISGRPTRSSGNTAPKESAHSASSQAALRPGCCAISRKRRNRRCQWRRASQTNSRARSKGRRRLCGGL
jgi:NAD(P)-dependent dehydrogenase (short-subunit alcohol dehydrogenase family)